MVNLLRKFYLWCLTTWYYKIIDHYMIAKVSQAKFDYKNSWKFKERYQFLGLDYASDYEKHLSDIIYHMKRCPKTIKLRLFWESMILRIPPKEQKVYYLPDSA